ncbi:hypothetical protein [Modicisalibacter radicis]|uniref:hypothetical protein n=1 Tax=Halomonas sp. EAR18 TaxID=2518972 RepID=UPI00109C84D4|nr:hypothetical protein [Halomonas sp. EAR18]
MTADSHVVGLTLIDAPAPTWNPGGFRSRPGILEALQAGCNFCAQLSTPLPAWCGDAPLAELRRIEVSSDPELDGQGLWAYYNN